MRNPLNKRYIRELKDDFGKYLVIFLFIVMLIGMISGFLIADNNFHISYEEGFEKYNVEDGHIAFNIEPKEELLQELEEKAELKFYELGYFEEKLNDTGATVRVYQDRELINTECVMSGEMPSNADEIALDRMFASNNQIQIGDTITLYHKELKVTGYVALVDYSCLFEKNTDMMFDSINFGVGIMTPEGFEKVGSKHFTYNYGWQYDQKPVDDVEENERSEELIDTLKEVIKAYDTKIVQGQVDELYAEAKALQEELEDEFEAAGDSIEDQIEKATKKAAEKAMAGLDQMEMMELVMNHKDASEHELAELIMEAYAKKQGTTGKGLMVRELNTGTTLEAFQEMVDSMEAFEEEMDEVKADTTAPKIDLDEIEDSENYENDMDFSMDSLREVVNKVDATGLYDVTRAKEIIEAIEALTKTEIDDSEIVTIKDYVPRYENKGINFTGEDMGSDAAMVSVLNYLVVAVMAFIFAVTISGTIAKEAGAIGTLRATGYTRGEMVRHYLALPMIVTIVACIIGNILGYTVFEELFVSVYYSSYSLATYETYVNPDAFMRTTVVTIVMMFVINLFVLVKTMHLTPLQFLRRELSKKKKRRAVLLNKKLPFMLRFRLRILFQNIPAYLTMVLGIILGGMIIVFGLMFSPLFEDYTKLVQESKFADYQYILMDQVETENGAAEKYCVTELDFEKKDFITDSIMIYGVEADSSYIQAEIPDQKVLISNGMAVKFQLSKGDVITLKDHYSGKLYDFEIGGIFQYDAALAVFMNRADYLEAFHEEEDYFTGYFSNEELTDLEEDDIASVITEKDLRKLADQMETSMGEMMNIFKIFGVVMFILIVFLMTKQIIEKNLIPISMTKILGFKNTEIGGLYLVMSFVVVLLGLVLSVPVIHWLLHFAFTSYIYKVMSGYIPFIVSKICYVKMIVLGMICYLVVCVFMMKKIDRIPKSEALKNVE